MDSRSLNTEELLYSTIAKARRVITHMTSSPNYKLVKSDNSLQVFRILMTNEGLSCLIYCSFFKVDSSSINGLFKVSNLPNGTLTENELLNLRSFFMNNFRALIEAKPDFRNQNIKKKVDDGALIITENDGKITNTTKLSKQNPAPPPISRFIPKSTEIRNTRSTLNHNANQVTTSNKGLWVIFWIIVIILAIALANNSKIDHVSGYERSNGTYVKSYDRKP